MNSCASLLFWGICRLLRTVRAVRYALRRICKWGELYLSWSGNVNSDKKDVGAIVLSGCEGLICPIWEAFFVVAS